MLDPNSVRVDLLRIKRKLYISYPEGSKERQEFLIASKLSELNHLQKLIVHDDINSVCDEYKKQQITEAVNVAIGIFAGLSLSIMLYGFHELHPHSKWLLLFPCPVFSGCIYALIHTFHAIKHWQNFKPFKQSYEKIAKKVEKIMKEIHDLTK